eukprot:5835795-Alexandrium_andersonii.AAC.1
MNGAGPAERVATFAPATADVIPAQLTDQHLQALDCSVPSRALQRVMGCSPRAGAVLAAHVACRASAADSCTA